MPSSLVGGIVEGMPPLRTLDAKQLASALNALPELANLQEKPGHDVLIYDGECRFCIAQVERLGRWAGPRLDKLPLQTPGLLEALGIEHEAAMKAMHLVTCDGAIYAGLEAAVQALRHRPLLGRLAMLYYVPIIRQLADLGYRLVARYRYLIMGRAIARGECHGSCALHMPQPASKA